MFRRSTNDQKKNHSVIDYLLYTLACTVIAAISFSFLLWLRF